ncbi:hypothetical protein L9G74_15000 [Shewanella sp. C32]|uniref:Uncharacterized protein n=1 Tax=Shewanella electrica TaxID=515560 RepID=A0ABT2FN43_9GAMM|nr:hypothetical protein [Shewanella electrica]MCH1926278.1 hypothetical protein [Shewanella electrica]MCS4557755.1 hypothetical protein [Shewanella electrica]
MPAFTASQPPKSVGLPDICRLYDKAGGLKPTKRSCWLQAVSTLAERALGLDVIKHVMTRRQQQSFVNNAYWRPVIAADAANSEM